MQFASTVNSICVSGDDILNIVDLLCVGSVFMFTCLSAAWWYVMMYHIHSSSRPCPISAHPLDFEVKNLKIINHLPRYKFINWYKPTSIWLGISLKTAQTIHLWVDPSHDIKTNKRPPKLIYLSTLGAYWNENGWYEMGYLVNEKLPINILHYQKWTCGKNNCSCKCGTRVGERYTDRGESFL